MSGGSLDIACVNLARTVPPALALSVLTKFQDLAATQVRQTLLRQLSVLCGERRVVGHTRAQYRTPRSAMRRGAKSKAKDVRGVPGPRRIALIPRRRLVLTRGYGATPARSKETRQPTSLACCEIASFRGL
eukprot:467837-Rhodomonas_salina.1